MIRSLLLISLSLLAISSGVPQWRKRPVTTELPVESLIEYLCEVHGVCDATESTKPVQIEENATQSCRCVKAYMCRGSFIDYKDVSSNHKSVGGEFKNQRCGHYLERCCKEEDIMKDSIIDDIDLL